MWISRIWNCSLCETIPPIGTTKDKDTELLKGNEIMDFQEANTDVELVDSIQPVLQSATVCTENLEKRTEKSG